MKNSLLARLLCFILLPCLVLTGCAGVDWTAVGTNLITDVQQGTVAATDAYAAYQAINQQLTTANVTTGKLDAGKVLAAANAITGTLSASPSLTTAVNQLVVDANTTIQSLKGSSTKAIITAVSTQGAGTVTTIAALPSNPPPTLPFSSTPAAQ